MHRKEHLRETIPHYTQSAPFSVHRTAFGPPAALYLHWHPEFEILLVKEGSMEAVIEDQTVYLSAGEGIFIPPSLLHRAQTDEEGIFFALVADPVWVVMSGSGGVRQRYVRPVCGGSGRYIKKLCPDETWQRETLELLDAIFAVPGECLAQQELFIHGSLMIIWQRLYEHHIRLIAEEGSGKRAEEQLADAVSRIHDAYASDLTLRELALLAHMSEGQFCRSFKLVMGMTPFHYLNRCRILQSCRLLSETDKKISEVAMLCGFNTVSYFNRKFAEITGTTPSAYRAVSENR